MGVIVKGVNIPKNCLECKFTDSEWGVCVLDQPNEREPEDYMKRSDWCPLTQIPPHGRLVDADALLQEHERIIESWGMAHIVSAQAVRNAPTIIEAEEE